MRKFGILTLWIVFTANINAQRAKNIPPEKPRLIIQIVVEQMRYDYLFRYWNKFGDKGFRLLVNEGTFCKNATYNYMANQSGVGHATIVSGTVPAVHGIVSTEWYERLKEEEVYCTSDPSVKAVGGSYLFGAHSPTNLLVTTLGDEMKLSNFKQSKVFSIGFKERSSIISGGHMADASYWFDLDKGEWMTSSYYMDSLPAWLIDFNAKKIPDTYLDRQWIPLLPLQEYAESLPDLNNFETGFNKATTFPYDLEKISKLKRGKRDYNVLLKSPYGNSFLKDFALQLILNENIGRDEYTDFLSISFSSGEEIGYKFGPSSVEMEDTYLRLDKDIEHLLEYLDKEIGKQNVLIYLTSDHGVSLHPDYLTSLKIPSGYFNIKQAMSLLRSYLNVLYGAGNWIKKYDSQQLFLNQDLIEKSNLSLDDFQNKVARFMVQFTGVANAVTASALQSSDFTDGELRKIQNSYYPKRSGDVIISLQPGWVEENGYVTGHHSAYTYDIHVPLIWYGWKVRRATINKPVSITDIAPTISSMLNISRPNASTGELILELLE